MKGVTILICAVFGIASAIPYVYPDEELTSFQRRVFGSVINKTINDEIAKLAQYDPATVPINQQDVMGHSLLVENGFLEGFSKVYASRIKRSGFFEWTIEVELIAPRVVGSVKHWKVDGDKIYGDGSVNIALNGLRLSVNAKVNSFTKVIKTLQLRPTIQNVKVSITGIFNNEELSLQISNYLGQVLSNLGNSSYNTFFDKLGNIVKDAINSGIRN